MNKKNLYTRTEIFYSLCNERLHLHSLLWLNFMLHVFNQDDQLNRNIVVVSFIHSYTLAKKTYYVSNFQVSGWSSTAALRVYMYSIVFTSSI